MQSKSLTFLDVITILSFVVGLYALKITLDNLEENRSQNKELKEILDYLENHLQNQDELFDELSNHLEKQDNILKILTKGDTYG